MCRTHYESGTARRHDDDECAGLVVVVVPERDLSTLEPALLGGDG